MTEEYERIHIQKIKEIDEKLISNRQLLIEFEKNKREYERYKIAKKPSFLAKIFNASSIKKYEESIIEYENLKQEYERKKQIVEQLQTEDELYEAREEIQKILNEGRIDINIVIKYYLENNIPIILTETDQKRVIKQIANSYNEESFFREKRRIEKLEDIMLVHKTNFVPNNEEIGTRMSSNVIDTSKVTIEGKTYNINLRPRRNTVHFSVNHEVTPNSGGSWSVCKYAVIAPLLSIPKEQFGSNNCVDTFTIGKVKLNNQTYIICPKDEIDEVKKKNPSITIIGYEGDNVLNYANVLLWMLGYSVEIGNDWGFNDTKRQNDYTNMILKSGYSSVQHHWRTSIKHIEEKNFYISFIVGILELIKNNSEMYNIDSQIIIKDSEMDDFLYYCDEDTYKLFNYYLSEIGLEPNHPPKRIESEHSMDYCKLLIDKAKELGKNQAKKL